MSVVTCAHRNGLVINPNLLGTWDCWLRPGEGRLSSIHRLKSGLGGILYKAWQSSCWQVTGQARSYLGVAASVDDRVGKVNCRVLGHGYMRICFTIPY